MTAGLGSFRRLHGAGRGRPSPEDNMQNEAPAIAESNPQTPAPLTRAGQKPVPRLPKTAADIVSTKAPTGMPEGAVVVPAKRTLKRGKAKKREPLAKMPGSAEKQAASSVIIVRSPDDRLAEGKSLREKVARIDQGKWRPGKARPNPIDLLRKSDRGRMSELVPIRYGRMLVSPFTFYRGSAGVMASDLARLPTTGLRVQSCGDCHLLNFGGFATPERNLIFSINDFDETLPAPWEWDLKRLVASVVLAARTNGISEDAARDIAIGCARSYREHLNSFASRDPLEVWYSRITADDFIAALPRRLQKRVEKRISKVKSNSGSELDFPKLADTAGGQIRIRDQPPLIFHPAVVTAADAQDILRRVLSAYRETLANDRRALFDQYHVVDAAIKVVGIGSVGRRCWIVLMMSEGNNPLFLQVKEAAESVLEPYAGKSVYGHHGQRVVVGQHLMQPASDIFLGWVTDRQGHHYYVRQLRDAKIKPLVETFEADMLDYYARACGWELARAHAKGGEVFTISGYLGNSGEFDDAMGSFAIAYADQTERDHAALKSAVRAGKVPSFQET